MSDKRYEANIIRATAVEPANNLQTTSAPGVWSIDEVVELQKKEKWPTVGNVITNAENVFSTFLYDGTGANQAINNGIDLTEGGLVWLKSRDGSSSAFHTIYDTARGTGPNGGRIFAGTASTNGASTQSDGLQSFNSNGFTLGANLFENGTNASYGTEYVSFTFRKQTKFFDVVTYTGDGSSDFSKKVSHNLGQRPGMVFVKNTSASSNWLVWYPLMDSSAYNLHLNNTNQSQSSNETNGRAYVESSGDYRLQVSATGTGVDANKSGDTYVAYFFAHNNNDGEFGPDSDQDIIKCGSYTGNGSTSGPEINLGFEPQWLMIKRTEDSDAWNMWDIMRGWQNGSNDSRLRPDDNSAESTNSFTFGHPTATGFKIDGASGAYNQNNGNYIYMAIRRGPLAVPTDATKVFAIDDSSTTDIGGYTLNSNFPVDFYFFKNKGGGDSISIPRLTVGDLRFNSTGAEDNRSSVMNFDSNTGVTRTSFQGGIDSVDYAFRRAPGYFDVVAYTGNNNYYTSQNITHNLGVVPEMIWIKNRDRTVSWAVYNKTIGAQKKLDLNGTSGASATSSVFTVGNSNRVNQANENHIAFLWASVAGVSKVGSVSHTNGSTTNVDCGFSSGARFILLKRYNDTGNWVVFDSTRGIVAGNDPYLLLDKNDAEDSYGASDAIDPLSSGFTITGNFFTTGDYIFYAIA